MVKKMKIGMMNGMMYGRMNGMIGIMHGKTNVNKTKIAMKILKIMVIFELMNFWMSWKTVLSANKKMAVKSKSYKRPKSLSNCQI